MCQVFFNVHVYAKQKINLTWPKVGDEIFFLERGGLLRKGDSLL